MLTCMVVDDEQHAVDLLVHHVKQTPFLSLVHHTTNPVEAIQKLSTQKIDLVFLDVQMPQLSGLEFIKATKGKCHVILCTAYPQYALEGFDHDVVDYLLKPVTYARFIKGAQKALNLLSVQNMATPTGTAEAHIFIKTENKGKQLKINFDDIDFVEGQKNYVAFHVGGEKIMALLGMKEAMEMLPASRFIRVHNSFIVPVEKISMIEGNMLGLSNNTKVIPIGITYKEHVVETLKIK
jgi:two-component system LytT family response regulator